MGYIRNNVCYFNVQLRSLCKIYVKFFDVQSFYVKSFDVQLFVSSTQMICLKNDFFKCKLSVFHNTFPHVKQKWRPQQILKWALGLQSRVTVPLKCLDEVWRTILFDGRDKISRDCSCLRSRRVQEKCIYAHVSCFSRQVNMLEILQFIFANYFGIII